MALLACAGLLAAPDSTAQSAAHRASKPERAPIVTEADVICVKAEELTRNGQCETAIALLNRAIRQHPDCASLYGWRARLKCSAALDSTNTLRQKALLVQVEHDIAQALALDKTVSNAYYARARLELLEPNEEKALKDLGKAIELDGKNLPARYWRSQMYEGEGKYDAALKDLDVMVNAQPTRDTLTKRALMRRHARDFKGAIDDLTHALKLEPSFIIFVRRGDVYEQVNENEKAIADFREALKSPVQEKDRASLHKKLARIYFELKRYAEASKELEAVLAIYPGELQSTGTHLTCQMKLKKWDAALKDANSLIEWENGYYGYYRQRAEIYRNMGKADLASADEQKAKQLQK